MFRPVETTAYGGVTVLFERNDAPTPSLAIRMHVVPDRTVHRRVLERGCLVRFVSPPVPSQMYPPPLYCQRPPKPAYTFIRCNYNSFPSEQGIGELNLRYLEQTCVANLTGNLFDYGCGGQAVNAQVGQWVFPPVVIWLHAQTRYNSNR